MGVRGSVLAFESTPHSLVRLCWLLHNRHQSQRGKLFINWPLTKEGQTVWNEKVPGIRSVST